MKSLDAYEAIYDVVSAIPRGKVATYGQVAELARLPARARLVGYALGVLPDDSAIPWHRVVNASGGVSDRGQPASEHEQRLLLSEEGVEFRGNSRGRVNRRSRVRLDRFQWHPEDDGF